MLAVHRSGGMGHPVVGAIPTIRRDTDMPSKDPRVRMSRRVLGRWYPEAAGHSRLEAVVAHTFDAIDELAVNTIRFLSADGVQKANSGHPGTPMALAPVAYVLSTRFLRHNPANPAWPDRDRFVLSCGHASMLLYSTLFLTGYDLSIEDLKSFRQWGSRTPGHPEYRTTPGVEMTTGPLGQGCATSVGMAIAEAGLAARFNTGERPIVGHRTWVLCSDGDVMEGLSNEAASLAGHLGLGKLTWIWDDNRITIEGATSLAFTEDVEARFEALGWHVVRVADANDLQAVAGALDAAQRETGRPTLIAVRSHIAYGAPNKQDTAGAHGAPLGEAEIAAAKQQLGFPSLEPFFVPSEALERCRSVLARGAALEAAWQRDFDLWAAENTVLAAEWRRRLDGTLPDGWDAALPAFEAGSKPTATRATSGTMLTVLASRLPELIGGSADLAPSCKTLIDGAASVSREHPGGRNLHFGIRENAMGSILNGLALHGGFRPFGSTFLVFSDYMRPAIRLAALMQLPVIWVFTHDSIGVGEDGPTHQPVEHLLALRAIPGLSVLRPADANETVWAWQQAITANGPVALILSRQALPVLPGTRRLAEGGVKHGAYILQEADSDVLRIVLIATGSEVQLAVEARRRLQDEGFGARVVSMPSWELFDAQPDEVRRSIVPPGVPVVAVEAGVSRGWERYCGGHGAVVGIDRFGASAPGPEVMRRLGLTAETLVRVCHTVIEGAERPA